MLERLSGMGLASGLIGWFVLTYQHFPENSGWFVPAIFGILAFVIAEILEAFTRDIK